LNVTQGGGGATSWDSGSTVLDPLIEEKSKDNAETLRVGRSAEKKEGNPIDIACSWSK
jgi:hypothetical protein